MNAFSHGCHPITRTQARSAVLLTDKKMIHVCFLFFRLFVVIDYISFKIDGSEFKALD